ncbi:isoprenylcysteine carboxylmethyltransferase family protein [Waterburya agarophytonicola K14]|uniref:Isoprenylcysteine carboxylmethyltransferase family protein n=1 Tax=Waterburya agarophytonicola KI4 TaxID=2874699 RepID=A0A964FKX0_9CYAN|nr:isoprenylcysteine carboxylmethyltransferase family protein [Waterburya agarophytonicola]MCC0179459.1 isoprenylcysteine carboxylmethyltransferase family protein [Waterburya agarophytonicola KI4]
MLSLILVVSFLLVVVFFRVFVQYRRTGDFGVRFAKIGTPLIEILPGTVFVLTFILAVAFVIFGYLGKIQKTVNLPIAAQYIGLLVGLTGISVTVISQFQMGDSWRIGVDQKENTTLITHGLYSKSRNPIYFGIFLFWIGLSITFPNELLWICALICWGCIELIVRKNEEPYLKELHGQVFEDYFARTNRYLIL